MHGGCACKKEKKRLRSKFFFYCLVYFCNYYFVVLYFRREKKIPTHKMSKKMQKTIGKMQMYKKRLTTSNSTVSKSSPENNQVETSTTSPEVIL